MDINRFVQLVREAAQTRPDQHGVTRAELQEAMGCCRESALALLNRAIAAGAIRVEQGFRTNMVGITKRVHVYVPAQGAGDERAVSAGTGATEQA